MSNILDDLINIRTRKQKDDLLKMMDEISDYEKLSADENLKDLKTSAVTRAKCPMLAAYADGKLYESLLADLVANIYLQIEGFMPDILISTIERTEKQQKQMTVLKKGIVKVNYRELAEYEHESMKDMVAAIFTKKSDDTTIIVIIVKATDGYIMYHGSYKSDKIETLETHILNPIIIEGQHGIFKMNSYSVLGNNGYRFGSYMSKDISCDVMLGPEGELYLMNGNDALLIYTLKWEDKTKLNLAKKMPEEFARQVTSIIESVV